MGLISKIAGYSLRALKVTPKLVFGTNSEAVGKVIRSSYKGATTGSIFSKATNAAKLGFKSLENGVTGKAFFKSVLSDIKLLPKFLTKSTKLGINTAKAAGKSSILGGIKGFLGGVTKKMPLIGTLVTMACELPNIFKAGKEKGVGEAAKETLKAGAKLAGGAAGAAIGSAICPGVGSLIGYIAGEFLTGLVVGKSYKDKQDEATLALNEMGISEDIIDAAKEQGYNAEELLAELQQLQQEEGAGQLAQTLEQPQRVVAQEPALVSENQSATNPIATNTSNLSNIDYASIVRDLYGGYNPYSYQSGLPNVYANDIFYKQAFGEPTNLFSNQNQLQYLNPYQQQTFRYNA